MWRYENMRVGSVFCFFQQNNALSVFQKNIYIFLWKDIAKPFKKRKRFLLFSKQNTILEMQKKTLKTGGRFLLKKRFVFFVQKENQKRRFGFFNIGSIFRF